MAALPLLAWPEAVSRAATIGAVDPGAWFTLASWPLVRILAPLVILSATILWLAPGLLLTIGTLHRDGAAAWLLRAAVPAVAVSVVEVELLRLVVPASADPRIAVGVSMLVVAVLGVVAGWRHRHDARLPAAPDRHDRATIVAALVGVVILVECLLPKLLWESFNGDGAHAFEVSRRLLTAPWPFFPPSAGPVAAFPGVTSMLFTWPNAWFLRVLGPIDAAVRVPLLAAVALTAAGVQAIAAVRAAAPGRSMIAMIWVGLVPYLLAMAFSATYSPYHADLALPAVQDTLLIASLLGFIHAMVRRERGWAIAFGAMLYTGLPNGTLLIGAWLVAELLVVRPRPWRVAGGLVLLLMLLGLAGAMAPLLLRLGGAPVPGTEYGAGRALHDVLTLAPFDAQRIGYLLIGAGIFPALLLGWWHRQDDVARRVTLVTIGYFGFFFLQARIALHHFAPAMILPLIVAVRLQPADRTIRRGHLAAWAVAAAIAIVLSAPREFRVVTASRQVGATITQQVGSYAASDPAVFAAAEWLRDVFPPEWDRSVPAGRYGGSPLAWLRYARTGAISDSTVYLLERDSTATAGGLRTGSRLVILDSARMRRQQALHPPADAVAAVYAVPRDVLFGGRVAFNVGNGLRRFLERVRR